MAQTNYRNKVVLGLVGVAFASGCAANIPRQADFDVTPTGPNFVAAPSNIDPGVPKDGKFAPADGAPSIIVHVDPKTGKFIVPQNDAVSPQISPRPGEAAKASRPDPQPMQSPVPGGGVMIQLGDRFRSPLSGTVDADGKVRFKHEPPAPESDPRE